jgi:hypothetical protein
VLCCAARDALQAFDHPTISSIASFLTDSHLLASPPAAAQESTAHAAALQLVTAAVRELLGPDGAPLDPTVPLMSAGLNSTLAVTLAASIEAAVGNPVPPTLVSRGCNTGRIVTRLAECQCVSLSHAAMLSP